MLQPAQTAPEPQKAEAAEYVMTVAKDPRYARYLKMVQVVSHFYHLLMNFKKKKKKNQCLTSHCMFYLPQGVPVMAIRNKMVMEGLDPNLLEWVLMIVSGTNAQLLSNRPLTFFSSSLPMTAHRMPPCLTEGRGEARIKTLPPPALTANRLSATDICPLHHRASCQGQPSLFWAPVGRYWEREVGCRAPEAGV